MMDRVARAPLCGLDGLARPAARLIKLVLVQPRLPFVGQRANGRLIYDTLAPAAGGPPSLPKPPHPDPPPPLLSLLPYHF